MNDVPKETLHAVSERIYEAYQTLHRLPDRERQWLNSNLRSSNPEIVRDWHGYSGEWKPRILLSALTKDITEMEEVLTGVNGRPGWLPWLGIVDREVARIVYRCCALNKNPIQVGRELGYHRNTIRYKRDDGLRRIARKFLVK